MEKEAIRNWPEDERPREKLLKFGEHNLSNTELLAILLRTGIRGESAMDLARRILQKFKTFRNMSHTDLSCWKEFKGLGKAKLCQIKAALEIGRRFQEEEAREKRIKINSSKDVANLLLVRMRDLKKEVFKVLLLDGKNKLIDIIEVEEGSINEAHPIIREIIFKALQNFSAGIICIHNHPSGDPAPSQEDRDFTKQIKYASEIMQIKLLDHIIIGDNEYFSFADEGLI
ncbi:MAG: DNA repair protein RadC [Candidatus Omnitrophica bacterium]|nr:DNA repair protein RadC [Candidatus Omnitrophota bacterium]MCM8826950.1 DNA repair protein RadC [Candidatus Omnitrophota bacterium]